MKMLSKEQLLNSKDLPEVEVECPDWGGSVKVKGMSVAKRKMVWQGATIKDFDGKDIFDLEKFQIISFIECVIEPKFSIADYEPLKNKSAAMVEKVNRKIMELSGITTPEEAKKSLEPTPTA